MFRAKFLISLSCAAVVVYALMHAPEFPARGRGLARSEDVKESGPFPSDWFLLQRTWPDRQIDYRDYIAAQCTAERLRSRSLDDPPPWTPVGPTNIGGRISDIVGHPNNPQILYVAAASGGIFKTVNGGTTWNPIFDDAPGLSMGALAMDPVDPQIIFAGTGEACASAASYFGTGIYRSLDGGTTWTHLGLDSSRYIARVVVDPANSQSIWVAAMGELFTASQSRGVYHTADGGQTWQRLLFVNDSTGCSDIVINPNDSQRLYAAMWQRIRTPETRRSGGRGSGIFRSSDGGTTWDRLTDGLPQQADTVGRIGLAISQSNPNILYACYANHPGNFLGVFRTSDGGDTWSELDGASLSALYNDYGWYFGNIRVRPDNPNVVFVLGVGLVRSTNGGQSWSDIGWDLHVDHHAMWFDPVSPFRILEGNDGGVYRSLNNGNGWSALPGLPVNQFYAATVNLRNPAMRMGGTQDVGTLLTTNGQPNTYREVLGGDGFYCLIAASDTSETVYAEMQNGDAYRSTDRGNSWSPIVSGAQAAERRNWCTPLALAPGAVSTIYYGAQRLFRSIDSGREWTAISPDLTNGGGTGGLTFGTITTIGVSPVNPDVIYVGTDDANVWVTRNGGTSWVECGSGLPQRWITRVVPDPAHESTVYVTISGYRNAEQDAHLLRSDDFGQNWLNIGGDLPMGPLNDVVRDPQVEQRLYVASDFGTYVTIDGGAHWMVLGAQLPRVPVMQLVLHNGARTLTAATYGRSMFTLDLNQLNLNRPPVITAYSPADLDSLHVPQDIHFSVTAFDPDGDLISYRWTRNGQEIGTDSFAVVEFDSAGPFEHVVVAVSDSQLVTLREWAFQALDSRERLSLGVPRELQLSAYPNPFNGSASIEFSLPEPGRAELAVFDVCGRRTATLMNGVQPSGRGRTTWSAMEQPSGTYFLRLNAGGRIRIEKILLIR
jgi:photosystem II stability/assembly factor-like uncharacterized protein